jgi:hypothetical protein
MDVSIDNLKVKNFKEDGIVSLKAANFFVSNVVAENNGVYGITRFDTTGGGFINNVATGSGEAGIYIGDTAHVDALIAGNDVSGNAFGILYRHAQHASIRFNTIHDNCIGILALAAPAPSGTGSISNNTVCNNNKLCKGNADEIPFNYSGAGIVLWGSVGNRVTDNAVLQNRGTSPISGGIVLMDGKSIGGPAAHDNLIARNVAFRNAPADIVNHSGGKNVFRHNVCSKPRYLC